MFSTSQQMQYNAKYPTGIVKKQTGPEGKMFNHMGVWNRLKKRIQLDADERKQFNAELDGKNYKERLNVMADWFGILFKE